MSNRPKNAHTPINNGNTSKYNQKTFSIVFTNRTEGK